MPDGSTEDRIRTGIAPQPHAGLDRWVATCLVIAAVVLAGASFLVWDAVQDVLANQREAKTRGCLLLAQAPDVTRADLDRVGCPR